MSRQIKPSCPSVSGQRRAPLNEPISHVTRRSSPNTPDDTSDDTPDLDRAKMPRSAAQAMTASGLFDGGVGSIMRLAGFLSLSGLFATSAILIDANMVAPVGDETLAGLGLAASLYGLFMALLFGLGSAAQILLTRADGANDPALFYARLFRMAGLGLGVSLVLVLLFRFNIHFLVDHLATTSGIGFAAKRYLGVMVYGLPITSTAYLLSLSFDVRRQAGREVRGFALEIPLNLVLNAFLIYGFAGAPKLGIAGAAIATLISQGVRLVYLILLVFGDWRAYRMSRTDADGARDADLQPRSVLIPVSLNVATLIVGAQAYQLLFAQLPYLSFAALALMMPWLSISNVLGRAVALAATISTASEAPGSMELRRAVGAVLSMLKSIAPKLALLFLGALLLVGGLSWHISGLVRIEFLALIPLAALLVLIRCVSVTIGAVLRATGWPHWVFRTQLLLQWGFGLPLLLALVLVFEPPLLLAFAILILEEAIRLAVMALKLISLRKAGRA